MLSIPVRADDAVPMPVTFSVAVMTELQSAEIATRVVECRDSVSSSRVFRKIKD